MFSENPTGVKSLNSYYSMPSKGNISSGCLKKIENCFAVTVLIEFRNCRVNYCVINCLNINRVTIYRGKCPGIVTLKVLSKLEEQSTKFPIPKMKLSEGNTVQVI